MTKPSAFKDITPMDSLAQEICTEENVRKVMCHRAALGDRWDVTWKEYKASRGGKPGSWTKESWEKAAAHAPNPDKARAFSSSWRSIF